jgi:phosphoglycolate phosphatase
MPCLIVFDLDGTLVDSRQDLAESANELIGAHGGVPLGVDTLTGMVGEGARVLIERALAASGLDVPIDRALAEFLSIYDRRLTAHTRCYPGVEQVLSAIVGRASLAVLTNKPAPHTRRLLDHLGLAQYFRWVLGADGGFPRKPDPAALLFLMREAGSAPAETLYVGDSMIDVVTARRAGVKLCAAAYGFARFGAPLALDGSELVAETPADLLPRLEEFVAGEPRTNAT